jgi:hypothetical protein
MFQQMKSFQKDRGVTNPHDVSQEANAEAAAYRDYKAKYNNDLAKILAALNWGPGALDRDIAAHGDAWLKFAPAETQRYISDILARQQTNIHVSVTNETGAHVAITANGVRQ